MMASESQNEDDQQQQVPNSDRFSKWVALAILSLVSVFSLVGVGEARGVMDAPARWTISVSIISMVFASIGVACYMFARSIFMGQITEVVVGGLILAFWSAGLPVLMNPKHEIAVSGTEVINANLYFSSWGCFVCIVWICGSLAKEMFGVDLVGLAQPITQSKQGKWYGLAAVSLIVMGSSSRVFIALGCSNEVMSEAKVCSQTKYAIAASVIGSLMAGMITWALTNHKMNQTGEWASSLCMLIIWSCGLVYITFGKGPGHAIGNLYFATWGCFVLGILLFAESVREYLGIQQRAAAPPPDDEENFDDVPVETDENL